jgi:hypothetical protein
LSRPIQASTSNHSERACAFRRDGPAPNSGLLCNCAVARPIPEKAIASPWHLWVVLAVSPVGSAGRTDRSLQPC